MQRQTRYQAAILENHRILLLRIEEQDDSFWVIPGGGQEDSESEEECVIREVQEETHLQVEVERLIFHDKARPPDLVYQQYKTYLCRIVGGVARPGVEPELGEAESPIKDIGWFDLRAVDSWDWHNSSPSFALILLKRIRKELGYE
jgi:8-oxo-dGTP pyrophosphatase MutT (NUDIX family)